VTPLYLRVDVCTYRGLRDGVPGVLDILKRVKARATFFVAFGPDASGLAMLKMLNPSFAWKMLRSNAVGTYGFATAFYGTLLPSPLIGAGLPDIVRRISDEGHEIGMHGWDHRRWQDRLPTFKPGRATDEFQQMRNAYRTVLGVEARSFAAPAWLVTREILESEKGLDYASDARGMTPFLATFEGVDYSVPQLPVTLPTIDEMLGRVAREHYAAEIVSLASKQEYACYTAHAEAEGREYAQEFEAILARANRPIAPLCEAPRVNLPRREMTLGRVEGRPYDVCVTAG